MFYQLQFWTLIAGLLAYIAKFFYPDLPLDGQSILAGVLFLLGLIGVVPTVRGIRTSSYGAVWTDLFKQITFWTMIVGVVGFVLRFYFPEFPYNDAVILSVIVFILQRLGINPQLRIWGFVDDD